MGYLAQWGPKGFLISPTKIVPFEDFATSVSLKADSENDTSGTAPTNTRGMELQPMSFSTTYLRAAGVDPRAQIDEWNGLIGQSHPLYIGGKRFGPAKMTLKKVEANDFLFTNSGDILRAVVKVTLEEFSEGKTSKLASTASKSASASSSTAASVYSQTVAKKEAEKKAAMNATASRSTRAEKVNKREMSLL